MILAGAVEAVPDLLAKADFYLTGLDQLPGALANEEG